MRHLQKFIKLQSNWDNTTHSTWSHSTTMQVQSPDQKWQPEGCRKYQQVAAQNALPVTCTDNGRGLAETMGEDKVKAGGGQVMRPPQMALQLQLANEGLYSKKHRTGEMPDGLARKSCTQKWNSKRQKMSRTSSLTVITYLLMTQCFQESTVKVKVQCCFKSTEQAGREPNQSLSSHGCPYPFYPKFQYHYFWLLILLFTTTQNRGKKHKCCPKPFVSSIQ